MQLSSSPCSAFSPQTDFFPSFSYPSPRGWCGLYWAWLTSRKSLLLNSREPNKRLMFSEFVAKLRDNLRIKLWIRWKLRNWYLVRWDFNIANLTSFIIRTRTSGLFKTKAVQSVSIPWLTHTSPVLHACHLPWMHRCVWVEICEQSSEQLKYLLEGILDRVTIGNEIADGNRPCPSFTNDLPRAANILQAQSAEVTYLATSHRRQYQ